MSPELNRRLERIQGLIFDVDGVMTNGQIFYNGNGNWVRFFNIKDGMGIKRAQQAGLKIALITNSDTEDIKERAKTLKINDLYTGAKDKVACLEDLLSQWQLQLEDVAYMGDDYQDLPVLERVGLAIAPPNALPEVKNKVHFVTQDFGGMGAVREACELVIKGARP